MPKRINTRSKSEDYLTRQDVADILGVEVKTIYSMVAQGRLKFSLLGIIHRDDFREMNRVSIEKE